MKIEKNSDEKHTKLSVKDNIRLEVYELLNEIFKNFQYCNKEKMERELSDLCRKHDVRVGDLLNYLLKTRCLREWPEKQPTGFALAEGISELEKFYNSKFSQKASVAKSSGIGSKACLFQLTVASNENFSRIDVKNLLNYLKQEWDLKKEWMHPLALNNNISNYLKDKNLMHYNQSKIRTFLCKEEYLEKKKLAGKRQCHYKLSEKALNFINAASDVMKLDAEVKVII